MIVWMVRRPCIKSETENRKISDKMKTITGQLFIEIKWVYAAVTGAHVLALEWSVEVSSKKNKCSFRSPLAQRNWNHSLMRAGLKLHVARKKENYFFKCEINKKSLSRCSASSGWNVNYTNVPLHAQNGKLFDFALLLLVHLVFCFR